MDVDPVLERVKAAMAEDEIPPLVPLKSLLASGPHLGVTARGQRHGLRSQGISPAKLRFTADYLEQYLQR